MTDLYEQSETIGKLTTALSVVQGKIKNPTKNAEGYAGRYSYATLDHVLEGLRLHLAENGLALVQSPTSTAVVTTLAHESGEWIRFSTPIETSSNTKVTVAQAYGSGVTYARRYAVCGLFALYPDEDDDGHSTGVVDQRAAIQAHGDKRRTERQEPLDPYEPDEEPDHTYVAAMSQAIAATKSNAELDELAKRVKADKSCNTKTKQAIAKLGLARRKVLDTAPTSPPSANGG